jgi:hypothetical protein
MESQSGLQTFQISDSRLSHLNWHFPSNIKLRPLQDPEEDDFLENHKVLRSRDRRSAELTD